MRSICLEEEAEEEKKSKLSSKETKTKQEDFQHTFFKVFFLICIVCLIIVSKMCRTFYYRTSRQVFSSLFRLTSFTLKKKERKIQFCFLGVWSFFRKFLSNFLFKFKKKRFEFKVTELLNRTMMSTVTVKVTRIKDTIDWAKNKLIVILRHSCHSLDEV